MGNIGDSISSILFQLMWIPIIFGMIFVLAAGADFNNPNMGLGMFLVIAGGMMMLFGMMAKKRL